MIRLLQEILTVLHFRLHLVVLCFHPDQMFQRGLMDLRDLAGQLIQPDLVSQMLLKDPEDLEFHLDRPDRSVPVHHLDQ